AGQLLAAEIDGIARVGSDQRHLEAGAAQHGSRGGAGEAAAGNRYVHLPHARPPSRRTINAAKGLMKVQPDDGAVARMSDPPSLAARATARCESAEARSAKAEAKCGASDPGCRGCAAHPGYGLSPPRFLQLSLRLCPPLK